MIKTRLQGMAYIRYRMWDEVRLAYKCDNADMAIVVICRFVDFVDNVRSDFYDNVEIYKIVCESPALGVFRFQPPEGLHQVVSLSLHKRYPYVEFAGMGPLLSTDVDADVKLAEAGAKLISLEGLSRRRRRKTSR